MVYYKFSVAITGRACSFHDSVYCTHPTSAMFKYIGVYRNKWHIQVVDIFRSWWNNYKDNAKKFDREEHCIQKHLYEYFTLPGHFGFLHDVSVTLTGKTEPSCPTKREALHKIWILSLKIYSVNVIKCARNCGFGHLYWRDP